MIKPLMISSLVLAAFIVNGCASPQADQESGWQIYERFRLTLEKKGTDTDFSSFFTAHAYQDIREASDEERPYVKDMLAYPRYFESTFGHYEKRVASTVCLTVNGETLHGDAGSLSIEFVEESGHLRMNDANLFYVDTKASLLSQAKCPDETRI